MGSVGTSKSSSSSNFLSKQEQLDIILKSNPAEDEVHTWIREESDIMTFKEAVEDYGLEPGDDYSPDFTASDIQKALDTGKVTVYSSKPIENGNFVTPSAMEATSYSGDQTIYKADVDVKDIAWIDAAQGQLATRNKIKFNKISSKGLI